MTPNAEELLTKIIIALSIVAVVTTRLPCVDSGRLIHVQRLVAALVDTLVEIVKVRCAFVETMTLSQQ